MVNLIQAAGGRKFILTFAALFIVAFALDLPGQSKAEMITWLVGLFAAGNVLNKKVSPPSA